MPIEIEVGFKLPDTPAKERLYNDIVKLASKSNAPKKYAMTAEYYDTPTRSLNKMGMTLRRRLEDDEQFISIKTAVPNGARLFTRNTWECAGLEISAAIGTLVDMGAPHEFLELAGSEGFVAHGRYEYTRSSILVLIDDETSIVVNFDEGIILSDTKQADFGEVLFKLLYGDQDTLEEFAYSFENKYGLTRELSSKFERVLRLIRTRQ